MAGEESPSLAGRKHEERILDTGALRALAHPLRVKIYNILSQYGPQTASSLAERLGESSGSTSYHLRALAKHDLIRECSDRGTARERWWERPQGSVSFANPDSITTPAGRAATQVVMTEFLRDRNEELLTFVVRGISGEPKRWQESSMISTATARLTPEQAQALSERLMAIIDETVAEYRDQTGDDVRAVSIRNDVFPLPAEGESR
ncbi:transcriptional regulator [Microbacterium sp. C7(2022)]|uniref:ArsR/SmtB family transcription factor n=1 Tax=Microbacterium sp. C7(2022) TaxID=2992759 RepID=UPI00237B8554|nr:helix-turn-helix domain-containing protein [Microbacterium sp. C7(2022)]MDE0546970.1 helix-turn-helix domain-containing protein [Microbacterium sp. C7(2022)]